MAALDYAASLVLDGLLDVENDGSVDALDAFEDYSAMATRGQVIKIPELGAMTVHESGGNGQSAEALAITTNSMTVDKPLFANVYIDDLDDIVGCGGAMASKVAEAAYRKLRNTLAQKIIMAARNYLVASGDAGLVANAGADTLSGDDISLAEALVCAAAGVGQDTPLSIVGSSGFTAAAKGTVNFQLPTNAVGPGRLSYLNGRPYYQIGKGLESRAGDLDAVISDSVVSASNTVTQTIPTGHGFIRGGLVTTSGLTVDASTAVEISSTTATSVVHDLTASAGQQADHAGSLLSASSIALVFVKPWSCYAIAGNGFKVRVLDADDGPGYNVQVFATYGMYVRAGGVAAIHAPKIG